MLRKLCLCTAVIIVLGVLTPMTVVRANPDAIPMPADRAVESYAIYSLLMPGPPFDTFGPEAQAMTVQNWYENGQQTTDPYYVYIQDNIRAGKP